MPSNKKQPPVKTKKKVAKKQVKPAIKRKTAKKKVKNKIDEKEKRSREAAELIERLHQDRQRIKKSIQEKKEGKLKSSSKKKQEHREAVLSYLQEIERRKKHKYDGVMGKAPKWMPDPLAQEFEATRDFLLTDYSHEQILKFIEVRERVVNGSFIKPYSDSNRSNWRTGPFIPNDIEDKLDALNYILAISNLGGKKGLKAYLGEGPKEVVRGIVLSEVGREGGKQSKDKGPPPYHALLRELKAKDWATLLKFLEDDKEDLEQLHKKSRIYRLHSAKKIAVRVQAVDHYEKMIRFQILPKGDITENAKDVSVSFKALKNLIPKYRRKSRSK
jgi:hypothetical protein